MFWQEQELRDALAKQTGWKISFRGSDLIRPLELKIIWEDSNDNSAVFFYYVSFEYSEKTKKIHTIIITRNDNNLSTSSKTRKFKIE